MTAQPARIDLADLGPGVAWALEFDEDGRGRLLGGNSSIDLMHGRRFVWVHLVLGNVRTREWIAAQEVLPPEAREVFLSKDRHPSLHWGGEALWGTLHDVRHEEQTAGMEATDLRFALWPQFLLTARHHPARSAMAVKDQAEKGATFEDSAALFESLLVAAEIRSARPRKRSPDGWIRSKTAFYRTPSGTKARHFCSCEEAFLARSDWFRPPTAC